MTIFCLNIFFVLFPKIIIKIFISFSIIFVVRFIKNINKTTETLDFEIGKILNEKGIVTGVIEKSIVNPRELEIKLKQQQGTPVPIKYY